MTQVDISQKPEHNEVYLLNIKPYLETGACVVRFKKKDGTLRDMLCTLNSDLIPSSYDDDATRQTRRPNPDVLAVWDLEKEAWRSFRLDSIVFWATT
jgi:hypothetical protein